MTVEQQPFSEVFDNYKKYHPETEIVIDGDLSLILSKSGFPVFSFTELINNCLDQGAYFIWIKIEPGRIIVEDDVVHENPEVILGNLNSKVPKSTRHDGVSGSLPFIKGELERHGGELEYHTKEGRIMAVATWEEIYPDFCPWLFLSAS